MHRLAVAITVTLALSGCTRRQADWAMFAAEVAVAIASTPTSSEGGESTGVAVAAPDPDTAPPPNTAELQRAHDVAWELTRIAAHDARLGNCDAVVRTSKHVRVIDPEVFANVFLVDPPIQHCVDAAP